MAWLRRKLKPGIVTAPEIRRVWCVTRDLHWSECAGATAKHALHFLTVSLSLVWPLRLKANYPLGLQGLVRTILFASSDSFAMHLFYLYCIARSPSFIIFEQSIFSGERLWLVRINISKTSLDLMHFSIIQVDHFNLNLSRHEIPVSTRL